MFAKDRMTQPRDLIHHPSRDWCGLNPTHTVITQPLSSFTVISFKEGSTLKGYIERRTLVPKTFYTIGEALALLMKVIATEGMYDKGNPHMVLCSPELEEILNRKALLSTQLTDRIMSQVAFPVNYMMRPTNGVRPHLEPFQESSPSRRTSSIVTRREIHDRILFELESKFLEVIQSVSRKSRKYFTITEVTGLLVKYICRRRDKIIDIRNPTVALVSEDPLGKAFGLQAFHRTQLRSFMLRHMTLSTTRCNPQRRSRRKLPYTCK